MSKYILWIYRFYWEKLLLLYKVVNFKRIGMRLEERSRNYPHL
jgi:hypothetical protein